MRRAACRAWARALRRHLLAALVILGTGWFAGCYHYVGVDPAQAPPGSRVRVELTAAGAERLAAALDREGDDRVAGRLVEVSPDGAVLLEVSRTPGDAPVGVTARPLFSRVTLGAGDLLALELKKLDRSRTAFAIGGGAVLAGALVAIAYDTYGGGSEGSGPPVDEAIIPILTIRW